MQPPWFRLSVSYYRDPKMAGLPVQAEALYVRLLAYTVEHETDGHIPKAALGDIGRGIYGAKKYLAMLLPMELILTCQCTPECTYQFPPNAWRKWQESKEDTESKRAAHAANQRAYRARRDRSPGSVSDSTEKSREELYIEDLDHLLASPAPAPEGMRAALDRIQEKKWGTNGST
jgi:hypothetical protein